MILTSRLNLNRALTTSRSMSAQVITTQVLGK